MKKQYLIPSIEVTNTQVCQMLAESLSINNEIRVNGDEALCKESSWNIWNEE